MERVRKALAYLPGWLFSFIILIAILWLTLAPKPLGEKPPPFFPGADKIAHGIMFGGFVVVMLLDWQRKHHWRPVKLPGVLLCAAISSLLGVIVEFAQSYMNLGRSFEFDDMIADTAGAFLFAFGYLVFQKSWLPTY